MSHPALPVVHVASPAGRDADTHRQPHPPPDRIAVCHRRRRSHRGHRRCLRLSARGQAPAPGGQLPQHQSGSPAGPETRPDRRLALRPIPHAGPNRAVGDPGVLFRTDRLCLPRHRDAGLGQNIGGGKIRQCRGRRLSRPPDRPWPALRQTQAYQGVLPALVSTAHQRQRQRLARPGHRVVWRG